MDGLYRCLTAILELPLGGKTFRLRPLTLAGIAAAELHLLVGRESPFDRVAKATACQEILFNLAADEVRSSKALRVVRQAEMTAWLDSADGIVFTGRLCLRPKFPTLAACREFFNGLTVPDLRSFLRARDMASGMDLLSHFDWPASHDDAPDGGYIPWRRLFRWFADEHHWPPERVGKLTLYQLRALRADEKDLGGRARMSSAEAFSFAATPARTRHHDPLTMPSRVEARRRMLERRKGGRR